jgi:transposase InsO family protein
VGFSYNARAVREVGQQTDAGKATVTLLCKTFGISRAAYYAAGKRQTRPQKGLRSPRRPSWASSEEVLAGIREIIADNPAWGVRKVWATLHRKGVKVSRKRVYAIMRKHDLVLARDREPGEVTRGHVSVPEPNRRLATDMTRVWTRQDAWVPVTLAIDCGCRSLLGLDVAPDETSASVLTSVVEALTQAFGAPDGVPDGVELRSDHGPQYTGVDCAELVEEWNLEHTFAPVGRPTGNAVVERVIRTMKEEIVWLRDWDSAEQLHEALLAWKHKYNSERPHQALGYLTPDEYRRSRLGTPDHPMLAAA